MQSAHSLVLEDLLFLGYGVNVSWFLGRWFLPLINVVFIKTSIEIVTDS